MINLSPVNFLKNAKLNATNPINFKGAIKETSHDTFEKQSVDNTNESLINQTKKKIAETDIQIEELNNKLEPLKNDLLVKYQELKDKVKELFGEDLKEYKAAENTNNIDRGLWQLWSIIINYRSNFEDASTCIDVNRLLHAAQDANRTYKNTEYKISEKEKYRDKLKTYAEHLEQHPQTACVYNPDKSLYEIKDELENNPNIDVLSLSGLSQKLGLSKNMLKSYIHFDVIKADTYEYNASITYIIDWDFEPNKKFLSELEEKKKNAITSEELLTKYNFTEGQASRYIRDGKLVTLFGETPNSTMFLINPNDKVNAKTIEEHLKITPVKSEKYFRSYGEDYDTFLVPASYLSRLGFGTIKELHEAIKKGGLKGTVELTEDKKISVKVDIASKYSEPTLQRMRSRNPNIKSIKDLAKMLNLKQEDIEQALINDELTIIKEFIFGSDYKESFIDLRNEKNAQYVDKILFERELESSLKQTKNSSQSLRMKFVWALCPNTRKIARDEARNEGWVMPIIVKKEEEGEESLSTKEKIQLKSYYRNIWLLAGTEEYKNALETAREVLKEYREKGVEGIQDPQLRNLFINALSECDS